MKKVFIIIGIIAVVLGIVIFTGALIASNFNLPILDNKKYETHTFTDLENFENIEINTREADIELKFLDDEKSKVECEEREDINHKVFVENGILKIVLDRDEVLDNGFVFFSKTMKIIVYLTSKEYKSLDIKNITGNVLVPSNFNFENVNIKTTTGNITSYASVKEGLSLDAGTGDIKIENLNAKNINLTVSTGNINVLKVGCEDAFETNVSTGKANLKNLSCKQLKSTGGTGNITLKDVLVDELIFIERSTGKVTFDNCDSNEIYVKTTTGDVTGTLLTDKVFITKTKTGDISVPDLTSGGRCEIYTTTGDIDIKIVK